MTNNNLENDHNIGKAFIDAKKELFINKNTQKGINDLIALIEVCDKEELFSIKSIIALAYLEEKSYFEAAQTFYEIGEKYQAGFCELLMGNIDRARELWTSLPENSIVSWGIVLLGLVTLEADISPSFLQIRNYLECDISYLIKAERLDYAENVIAYADYLSTVHPEAYKFIGKALFNSEYPNLAMTYYMKGCELLPEDPEIYYHIAQYMISEERYKEARQYLRRAVHLNKNYLPARSLLESLDKRSRFKLF